VGDAQQSRPARPAHEAAALMVKLRRGTAISYRVAGGKRTPVSTNARSTARKPRSFAATLRWWIKPGRHSSPRDAVNRSWRPRKSRRKLGARRQATLLDTVFRWIKVPVKRRRRRR
jgi:hypothetical protein